MQNSGEAPASIGTGKNLLVAASCVQRLKAGRLEM